MARMPQQMYDLRPLKTVELTPPSYVISPQHLIDSCIEVEVKVCYVVFVTCNGKLLSRCEYQII